MAERKTEELTHVKKKAIQLFVRNTKAHYTIKVLAILAALVDLHNLQFFFRLVSGEFY